MTHYTVTWHEDALNELAQIWMKAADRAQVTNATWAIDAILRSDANSKGSRIAPDVEFKEMFVSSLRVWFSVSEPDLLVKVLHVSISYTSRRSPRGEKPPPER
jgi:hypothetical protein